jgi:hypothetical protein
VVEVLLRGGATTDRVIYSEQLSAHQAHHVNRSLPQGQETAAAAKRRRRLAGAERKRSVRLVFKGVRMVLKVQRRINGKRTRQRPAVKRPGKSKKQSAKPRAGNGGAVNSKCRADARPGAGAFDWAMYDAGAKHTAQKKRRVAETCCSARPCRAVRRQAHRRDARVKKHTAAATARKHGWARLSVRTPVTFMVYPSGFTVVDNWSQHRSPRGYLGRRSRRPRRRQAVSTQPSPGKWRSGGKRRPRVVARAPRNQTASSRTSRMLPPPLAVDYLDLAAGRRLHEETTARARGKREYASAARVGTFERTQVEAPS